jgi:mortality factor 4-like protein 1
MGGTKPSVFSVYGAEHLLRLFVRLGPAMSYAVMDEESVSLLLSHIHDFLQYMQENIAQFFQKEYTVAPV